MRRYRQLTVAPASTGNNVWPANPIPLHRVESDAEPPSRRRSRVRHALKIDLCLQRHDLVDAGEGVVDVVRRHEKLIRERFPKTLRRNAGYALDMILAQLDAGGPINLAKLLAGSEGTLALITKAINATESSLVVTFTNAATAELFWKDDTHHPQLAEPRRSEALAGVEAERVRLSVRRRHHNPRPATGRRRFAARWPSRFDTTSRNRCRTSGQPSPPLTMAKTAGTSRPWASPPVVAGTNACRPGWRSRTMSSSFRATARPIPMSLLPDRC